MFNDILLAAQGILMILYLMFIGIQCFLDLLYDSDTSKVIESDMIHETIIVAIVEVVILLIRFVI